MGVAWVKEYMSVSVVDLHVIERRAIGPGGGRGSQSEFLLFKCINHSGR